MCLQKWMEHTRANFATVHIILLPVLVILGRPRRCAKWPTTSTTGMACPFPMTKKVLVAVGRAGMESFLCLLASYYFSPRGCMQLARKADVCQPIRGKQLQRVTKNKDTAGNLVTVAIFGVGDASQTKRWHQDLVSHRQQTDAVYTVMIFCCCKIWPIYDCISNA